MRLTSSLESPPPPVAQSGRERGAHLRSRSIRKLSPPSVERKSWLVFDRVDSGQSPKMRLGSVAFGCDPEITRSIVISGSEPRKWASTIDAGAKESDVLEDWTGGGTCGVGGLR